MRREPEGLPVLPGQDKTDFDDSREQQSHRDIGHCGWALADELSLDYHDTEWGVPVHDDRQMFEHLTLECLQCGLSWSLMLKKREIFRACFDNFEYDRIAAYDELDVQRILNTEGMLRSERKVRAVIGNARCYQKVREEYGSFCGWLWSFSDGRTIVYDGHPDGRIPVSNGLSDRISRELKKRGFKYIGAITIYSHLQACGVINDHARACPCFDRINGMSPILKLPPDGEVGQAQAGH